MPPTIVNKSFRLFDFHIYDEREDEKTKFMIQMFGINELGETCSIFINDFQPFFYILVPQNWKEDDAYLFLNFLKKKAENLANSILNIELVRNKKLYGFTAGGKDLFACITFANLATKNRITNLWYSYDENQTKKKQKFIYNGFSLELYESSIPPLLRYFHIHNISPSGWISVKVSKTEIPSQKTTTCKYEYVSSKNNIVPLPDKETLVPYKICSFDIEASSSHGDFPIPVKTYKRLATNIVDVFYKHKVSTKDLGTSLLEKCILTAFGFSHFDDIDLVYPKFNPTKTELSHTIKQLLALSLEEIEPSKKVKTILTLDNLFSEIKTFPEKPEQESDAEEQESDADDEQLEESEEELESIKKPIPAVTKKLIPAVTKKPIPAVAKKPTTKKTQTIVDILINSETKREDKIQKTNEILTSLFPDLEGDKTTFIGSTFIHYGQIDPYLNHCIVVGCCSPVEGATIESVLTERDLLLKWAELIQTENPDILIGYNIFGFDYEFLFRRSLENNCEEEFLKLSRNIGHISAKKDTNTDELSLDNTKIRLATGEYDLYYPKMIGRFQIDLLVYFRKEFNLSSYKLDNVSASFIGDTISKIVDDESDVSLLYCKNTTGLNKNDYIHIELSEFTTDYFMDGKKFLVLDIQTIEVMEKKKGTNDTIPVKYKAIVVNKLEEPIDFSQKVVRWGLAKDDVSVQDIFRLTKGSGDDRAIVAKYCIQDCNIVHHLMRKVDILVGFIEMSRICSVPMSFLMLRGQGIKLTSFVAKKCREKDTLMPDIEKNSSDDGYEGAIVLPPKCSMYIDNPVACLDYSSLYPSNMISQNLSHDSKVWTKEYDLSGKLIHDSHPQGNPYDNLSGYHYVDVEFDTYRYERKTIGAKKVKCGKKVCRWAQFPDGKRGILPSILEELLKARKATKKMAEQEKDEFMKNILDKRQLAYKATANSLYGQCGSKTSTFYEKDIAASTTAVGRLMITYAKKMIEQVYGNSQCETSQGPVLTRAEYVYGDSVAHYTPVYIRLNKGPLEIVTIEDLAQGLWVSNGEKEFCELSHLNIESWSDQGWTPLYRIIRHHLASHKKMIRIVTGRGQVDVTDDHSLLTKEGLPISPKKCNIGTELLHSTLPNNESGKPLGENHIIEKYEIPYPEGEYVYDLTTKNHHFSAGIGEIVVHNTDSVFFTFQLEDATNRQPIRGKKALEITIELAQEVAKLCTRFLISPMELSYEKTLMPFILLSKKRYVGMLYETDPNKGKLKFMGLSLKRRDACDYLKDVYGGVLNILMRSGENTIQRAIDFLEFSLRQLIDGKVATEKLEITKALRSDYKNPERIGHKVLADRIGERDPGNKPKSGDRIKYVFFKHSNPKALVGERIETPEFILSQKLEIDYQYYITNQLMKPLQQLFGLAIEDIWKFKGKELAIKKFKKEMNSLMEECHNDLEIFMKKKEKITSKEIKSQLFDSFLKEIFNREHKIKTINSFFSSGTQGMQDLHVQP
jgi:DNA polymerase elongation subunit (family B)